MTARPFRSTMSIDERADIMREVMKQAALADPAAAWTGITSSVLKALGKPEEECLFEVETAAFLLIRSGLLESDGFNPVDRSITIGAKTRLNASKGLLDFMSSADTLQWKEVKRERYDRMLEIVTPAMQMDDGFLVGEPLSHRLCAYCDNRFSPTYTAFIERNDRYFESDRGMTCCEFESIDDTDPLTLAVPA